jgi:hypothetical protein
MVLLCGNLAPIAIAQLKILVLIPGQWHGIAYPHRWPSYPLGHPVNILVMGVGGYQFKDYLKVGLPLVVMLTIAVLVLLPIFWPL